VLIETAKVPRKSTASPGTAKVTVPETWPAMPPPVSRNMPVPSSIQTPASLLLSAGFRSPPSSPTKIWTFVAAIRTSFGGVEPAGACGLSCPATCSKAKSPLIVWPRMSIERFVASTRSECAAIVVAPTVCDETVLLTSSVIALEAEKPGALRAALPSIAA